MLEHQYSSELHPDPASCLCSYPSTFWQLMKVYMTSRPGAGFPLQTAWPTLTISMCSTVQNAGPKHVLLLGSHPRQTWLSHPCDRERESHLTGCFFMRFVVCAAAIPAQVASHPNFATTFLDNFLECLFRLFQILLADSLQDYYHEKKGSIQGKQEEFRLVSVNMQCRHIMKYCGYP